MLDTSAIISLQIADALAITLEEFDVHTAETVLEELETTAEFDDVYGEAAREALEAEPEVVVHSVVEQGFESSRIDPGEASCALLVRELEADFLITDDFRAIPELRRLVSAKVAISPILLRALVERGRLSDAVARERVETVAENRDWLGSPIYRRAQELFRE